MFVLAVIGFVAANRYISNVPLAADFADSEVHFSLWWTAIGAIGGFALAGGLYLAVVLIDLIRLANDVTIRIVATWLVPIVVLAALAGTANALPAGYEAPLAEELSRQTLPITAGTATLLLPGLVGFFVVRSIASHDENWLESDRCQVLMVLRLRQEVRHLLTVFGAFLTLLVVGTGLRRQALLAHDETLPIPSEQVLLYGLVFAVILGLFYLTSSSAIDDRAHHLVDRLAPVPDPAATDMSDQLRRRNDVTSLVGSGGSWRTFETSVVIAAPLLTGLISSATR